MADVGVSKALILNEAANNCVVIFSKNYCPYCKMAKEVFKDLNQDYKAIELDGREDMDDLQNALEIITGSRTVPRVFIGGKCYGGGTDIRKMHSTGELQKLLESLK